MSTKQSVIFTFMVIFLIGTIVALGAYFHYASELSQREKMIEILKGQRADLEYTLKGSEAAKIKGVRAVVKSPEDGLEKQLEQEFARAKSMMGDANSGAEEVRIKYEAKEPELPPKWNDAAGKWKTLYEEWIKQNGEIDASYKRLLQQHAERDTKTVEAQSELDRELQNESTEKKKFNEQRKVNTDILAGIRRDLETVQDRTTEVSRQTRRAVDVTPQGKVIFADDKLHLVAIDIGATSGVKYGMEFDVYSKSHANLVKKAHISITEVKQSSSVGKIIPAKGNGKYDRVSGWVPPDPKMRFSVYSTSGPDETNAQELEAPKTRRDRVDAYERERLEREIGVEAADDLRKRQERPDAPPSEIGSGFVPILAGDWVHNPEFIPIVTERAFEKKSVNEVIAMRDVNVATLTFFFTDSVRTYRAEFLKRLAERNGCKVASEMSNDVNLVVTSAGNTRIDLLEQKLNSSKGKEEVTGEIKNLRKTLEALVAGQKVGAGVIAEDQVEGYFAQRARKLELLRGNAIQPGRSSFFVAGETKQRSVEHTRRYIQDHGGVVKAKIDEGVDYVVVGAGLDQPFYEEVKRLGLKILREDELEWFFGIGKLR